MIFDGLKQWWLSVVAEEEKPLVQVVVVRDPVPSDGDDCPQCKSNGTMRFVSAGVVRCQQCAWQPRIHNPPGSPNRAALETFQYPDREHRQKFEQGFVKALARITGRGK